MKKKKRTKGGAKAKAAMLGSGRSFRSARHGASARGFGSQWYDYMDDYTPCRGLSFRWYGFDLDGTIADNTHHGSGMGIIGRPIRPMVDMMKRLNRQNKRVKIVTARLNDVGLGIESQNRLKEHIWQWCDEHLGFRPEITDQKDGSMECLYDDRARQVVRNTGIDMESIAKELVREVDNELRSPMSNRKALSSLRDRCIRLGLL